MSEAAPAFKLDENLPRAGVEALLSLGLDAVSVLEQGLAGAPDPRVAEVCRDERRVLVTLDLDFSDIRRYPPRETRGIIVLRVRTQDRATVSSCLRRVAAMLASEPIRGRLWIVDEVSVRVREGD